MRQASAWQHGGSRTNVGAAGPLHAGKDIVWLAVGSVEQEVGRYEAPCKAAAPVQPPDLVRMSCGKVAAKKTELRVRRQGGELLVERTASTGGNSAPAGPPRAAC